MQYPKKIAGPIITIWTPNKVPLVVGNSQIDNAKKNSIPNPAVLILGLSRVEGTRLLIVPFPSPHKGCTPDSGAHLSQMHS